MVQEIRRGHLEGQLETWGGRCEAVLRQSAHARFDEDFKAQAAYCCGDIGCYEQ